MTKMALMYSKKTPSVKLIQQCPFFFFYDGGAYFPDPKLLLIRIKSLLLSVMQATCKHVNMICLSQSAVSVHCFPASSKGSRVSLQTTQTS